MVSHILRLCFDLPCEGTNVFQIPPLSKRATMINRIKKAAGCGEELSLVREVRDTEVTLRSFRIAGKNEAAGAAVSAVVAVEQS